MTRELILGGTKKLRIKRYFLTDNYDFKNPTYLDIQGDCDVIHDLNIHPLPFEDNAFDEIHAYEILEHLSTQGNYKFFFSEFNEYWRILKDGGYMYITVPEPNKEWAFGDPGHTRVLPVTIFSFLDKSIVALNKKTNTPISSYPELKDCNFKLVHFNSVGTSMYIKLQAIKHGN